MYTFNKRMRDFQFHSIIWSINYNQWRIQDFKKGGSNTDT